MTSEVQGRQQKWLSTKMCFRLQARMCRLSGMVEGTKAGFVMTEGISEF